MRRAELASRIEHTALGPDVPTERVRRLCEEAIHHGFYGVCVNPCHVALAKAVLKEQDATGRVKVVTVVGFPHGTSVGAVKAVEAERAIRDGADELDMVINVAALKERDYARVLEEILAVREETRKSPRPVALKVILETALLSDEQKVAGCILAKAAGADFVKTSTGFGPGGATVEDVKLLKGAVGEGMGIKAAGGIRTYEQAVALIEAGADRLGTSAGVQIVEGAPE